MYPEPGKGTDGRRPLGEIRPRTVCPYCGTAQAGTREQQGRYAVQAVCGLAESVRADSLLHPERDNRHHSRCAGGLQRPPSPRAGTVGGCRRVRGRRAAAQSRCGCDGV
ncbi:hypothetical protein M1B79_12875 [Bacteroides sp. KH365_2]|uniref:Uncharacterized protein n=1 Tax=Bacteroides muris (ex Fokt et al. 2023) TaxID=2937417 RepID=A0A9X2NTA4_9BACE|nr:hypothetical protein [Bacteroides muris (ex Fokt et al. 2023)]